MVKEHMNKRVTAYSLYSVQQKERVRINPLEDIYPKLPSMKYQVIYADPPWDYGGKMQYDKSVIKDENVGFERKIFLSSAEFKYPTLKMDQLKELDVKSIADDDCILFMWTTGPQLANSVELGEVWGFEYKTVAFVWDKKVHNPGRYTLSQTEFVLVFKRGRFPQQKKIELFARNNYFGWDNCKSLIRYFIFCISFFLSLFVNFEKKNPALLRDRDFVEPPGLEPGTNGL